MDKVICFVYSRHQDYVPKNIRDKQDTDKILYLNLSNDNSVLCGMIVDVWIFRDDLKWDDLTDEQRALIYCCSNSKQMPFPNIMHI